MNTAGVLARVKNLFGDSNGIILTNPMLVDWINEAQVEIARETNYKQGTSTVTAASSFIGGYTSITDAIVFKDVTYRAVDGDVPLILTSEEEIERFGLIGFPDGEPEYYYVTGDIIYLFPTPLSTDATDVKIDYIKLPTSLTDENSSLDIPARWHNDVCNFVAMRAHERNENWRAAERYEALFNKSIGNRKFEAEGDDSFQQIQPDPGDNVNSAYSSDYDY